MNDDFAYLRAANPDLGSKIQSADVVFRHEYNESGGRKMPFSSLTVFNAHKLMLEPIYKRLNEGKTDADTAFNEVLKLMESYYEMVYPLNK